MSARTKKPIKTIDQTPTEALSHIRAMLVSRFMYGVELSKTKVDEIVKEVEIERNFLDSMLKTISIVQTGISQTGIGPSVGKNQITVWTHVVKRKKKAAVKKSKPAARRKAGAK